MIQVHFPNYATVFPDIEYIYITKIKDETHHNIDISYTITDYRLRGRKKYHHHYRMFNSLDPQSLNYLHEYQIFSAFSISPTAAVQWSVGRVCIVPLSSRLTWKQKRNLCLSSS